MHKMQAVLHCIEAKEWLKARDVLMTMHSPDIAALLMKLDHAHAVILFRALPPKVSSKVFSHLDIEQQEALLYAFTETEAQNTVRSLSPDDRTALLEDLPNDVMKKLLSFLSPIDRKQAMELLTYPEESVGRLMTPNYVAVQPEWTITKVFQHIRKIGDDKETLARIYVIDKKGKLLDDLRLRTIILAKPHTKVRELMRGSIVSLESTDDREKAVHMMRKYDLPSLAVTDSKGILLGMVTVDDVLDVAQEEATEDIQKVGSVTPLKISYARAPIWLLCHRRVWWLGFLVFISLAAAGIISFYEETLSSAIALVFFIPVLIATGGNAGAQSATLVIRSLATHDVKLGDWFKVLFKEVMVGIILGVILGLATWALGLVYAGFMVGLVVALTMLCIIVTANLIGAMLPFVLSKVHIDPAVASAPLVTSVVDAVGLFIYLSIATWLLIV